MSHHSPALLPAAEPPWIASFLAALTPLTTIRHAAHVAHISIATAYNYRRTNPRFAAAWQDRRSQPRPSQDRDPPWVAPFLAALANGHSVVVAAGMVHTSLSTVYAYRASNTAFQAAWHERRHILPPQRSQRYTPAWKQVFVEALQAGQSRRSAAAAAGISLNHAYKQRRQDAHFRASWHAAQSPCSSAAVNDWQQVVETALTQEHSLSEIAALLRRSLRDLTVTQPADTQPTTAGVTRTARQPTRQRLDWQASFLQALLAGRSVIDACVLAGIVPNTAYVERHRNTIFGVAWAALGRPQRKAGRLLPENWQFAFLQRLNETGTVLKACRSVGIAVTTVYAERKRNPAFARAWDEVAVHQPRHRANDARPSAAGSDPGLPVRPPYVPTDD